jgi:hypothetical protein
MPVPAATLIDDFETYPTGNVRDTAASAVWNPNGSSFADVESDGSNKYFSFGWDDAGYRGAFRNIGAGIGSSSLATLFFKVRAEDDRIDHAIGLTDLDAPGTQTAGFPDFRAQIALTDDATANNNLFNLVAGPNILATGLTENVWYNVWMVIDNSTDTMDVYLNTGSADATAGEKLNASPIAFLNGTTAALDTFITSGSDSVNSAGQNVHVDDIHLASGVELGNPPVPEPSALVLSLLGLGAAWRRRRP